MKKTSAGSPGAAYRGGLLLVAVLAALGGSVPAVAAPAKRITCEPDPECMRLRDEAQRLYEKDQFQMALSALTSAYVIKADPSLLLNMGLTLIGLSRPQEALERCQQFELRVPRRTEQETQLLALCKHNVQRMEEEARAKALAEEQAKSMAAAETAAAAAADAAAAAKEKEQREQRQRPVYKRAWFWGVIGGVAAAGVIAGVTAAVLTSPAHRVPGDLEVFQVQLLTF